jgi:hypothetical protein
MLAPSKTRFGLPDVLSTIAGIRPFAMFMISLVACLNGPSTLWLRSAELTVDLKEPWLLLLVLAELELVHVVLEA